MTATSEAGGSGGDGAVVLDGVVVVAERGASTGLAADGSALYSASAADIANLPQGAKASLTDILSQMPGVAIDQNQQIHIRNTEGPQFQYRINGVTVPIDINTNPPFLSMLNPMFISQLDLAVGVLPARYSYATGGVVDIRTKDGCDPELAGHGDVTLLAGQRSTWQPSAQFAGCDGPLGYFVTALYARSNTAFSAATPGPNALHDGNRTGQVLGSFSFAADAATRLGLIVSAATSDNQLPNVPGLVPQYALVAVVPEPSAAIDSHLNFRDALAILSIDHRLGENASFKLAYAAHTITEDFRPDAAGELIYQGVASTASHTDVDNTLQGDLAVARGTHAVTTGFYLGEYRVAADDDSWVFPVDQVTGLPGNSPLRISNNAHATNVVSGVYVNDLWSITDRVRANWGLRADALTGFTRARQVNPTLNVTFTPVEATALHGGLARYLQVPSFQGISPTAPAAFANTTAAGPAGIAAPLAEDDWVWDVGVANHVVPGLTLSLDSYYEKTHHYLDTGQFGAVPIFAPFNYARGIIWGSEFSASYHGPSVSGYVTATIGGNRQTGVATGQFNFPAEELAYIDTHTIELDHQPHVSATTGVSYRQDRWRFSADGLFSSGLRAGFADQERLPHVLQFNLAAERSFPVPGVGELVNRVTVLNVCDRVNLIRPAEGIGIFQSAYGPRLTFYDSLTLRF